MILAIVGSTCLADDPDALRAVEAALDEHRPQVVVSGGADGIDTIAAEAARRRLIDVVEFRPTVRRWDGPGGFKERNMKIARACDALVRIVARGSATYGSGWTRDRAREMGKPTWEVVV